MKINKEIEFETLHSNKHRIYLLCGIVCVVVLMVTFIITTSKAKYRVTQSIPLIQGTINFSPSDLNIVAMYLNQDGAIPAGETDIAPKFGYTLNEEQSFCEVNDEKIDNAAFTYDNGLLGFYNLNRKGTKCSVYFDLIPDSEKPILSISISSTDNSITVVANATDNIGIYYYYYKIDDEEEIRVEENSYTFEGLEKDSVHTITVRVEDAAGNEASGSDEVIVGLRAGVYILASTNPPTEQTTDWTRGTSYYYIGNPNNWIQFAGFWWRIIRINGDGSIRMIYQGTSTNTTGTGTQIGTSAFNTNKYNKTSVGLVYDGSTQHGYGTNSTIMNTLNTWYNNNLASYEEDYIDTGAGFCSDRNTASGDNYTDSSFYYAAYDRRNGGASLQCNDLDVLSQDNGKISNPIGLITSDEAVLTGITWDKANTESYLDVGIAYWTMTPLTFNGNNAGVFYVRSGGLLNNTYNYSTHSAYGIRPVINLRGEVTITGSGTTSDPFKVVGAS